MKYSILFAIGLALISPLQAAKKEGTSKDKGKPTPEEIMKQKDTDNDGFLTKEEYTAGAKNVTKAETAFTKKDKDADGKLSLAELGKEKNKADKKKGKGKKGENQ